MSKLLNITALSKQLNLINPKTKKTKNYVLRYWEKEFKEIKPKKINNRRYYTSKQVDTIKLIKFLLKEKGLKISGVKKILNSNINKLDDYNVDSLKSNYNKILFKEKTRKLLNKLNNLKNYGKKNTS